MKKLILVIGLLFAVLISFAQREVDADVVIVRDSINLDGEWIKFISPINGQVISRVDGVWKNTANTLSQPVDSIQFNSDVAPIPNTDYTLYADTANNSLSFKTGLGSTAQIARESLIKVYNNNGVTIPNGDVISTSGVMPDGTITVVRAIATNRYDALLWATTDIPVGEVGDAIVVYGSIRDVPTSGLISVGQVWLSDVDTGKVVKIKPTFPAYEYSLGAVTKIDAVTGQYEARLDGIDPYSTIRNTYNGQFRETIAATVASDGATITLSLERSGGGDLTQMWSSGLRDLDCTPACTVVLTAGTDIAPQPNYVYILKSNPDVLVVSTSGFPKGVEYEHVFDGALFSASRTQTDDALANRNWNDHIQDTIGQGHLLHISERIRQDNAQWNSGMTATMTVGGGTTIDISQTAGDAYQLHLQNVDAMNTATGSYMYVQNDFTTAWDKITDIESITTDANGNALLNTSYSLVTYSVANKSGETDQYVLTVPTGTYSKNVPQNAEDDLSNYAVYDFPSYLKGKAVLVAKFNIVNNNGTISLFSTQDLRGKVPNAAIGGGGGSTGAADFLSLLDTYSSYSGLAYTGLKVDLGEAGLIATQHTEDASGNFNIVGTATADSLNITNGATLGGNTEVDGYVLATINSVGSITFPLMVANTSLTIGTEAGIKLGASSAPDIRYAAITGYQEGSNTTNVKIYTGAGGTLTERIDVDGNTGTTTFSDDVVSPTYGTTEQTLTETAGAVAWDVSDGSEVGVTIDETSVITLTNIPVGWKGNIDITQGDAGDDNATFVASGYTVKWRNDEQDLTDASGAVDVVSLRVRGAIIYVTWGGPYVTQ